MKSIQKRLHRRSPKRQPVYKDTGCHIAPACLACPLPACIHDYEAAGLNRSMPKHRKRPAILRHRWRKLVRKPAGLPSQVGR